MTPSFFPENSFDGTNDESKDQKRSPLLGSTDYIMIVNRFSLLIFLITVKNKRTETLQLFAIHLFKNILRCIYVFLKTLPVRKYARH